jgi:uncharacterized protein
MKTVSLPVLHCYRCIYTWVPTKSVIRICPRCKSRKWDVPKIRRPPYAGGGLGVTEVIEPKRREVRALVRRHGFSNPRVFGSVARGEAKPESDVDLLVSRRNGGLLDQASLEIALRDLLGRIVEVVAEGSLKWYAEPEILAQAVPV